MLTRLSICDTCAGINAHYPGCSAVPVIAALGYGMPVPPLYELVGKRGRLLHSQLPVEVIEAHACERKVRIRVGRVEGDWIAESDLWNNLKDGKLE